MLILYWTVNATPDQKRKVHLSECVYVCVSGGLGDWGGGGGGIWVNILYWLPFLYEEYGWKSLLTGNNTHLP